MAGEPVSIILEPNSRRQLGDEGLIVFWRDAHEPGEREGLACSLSMCPNPDCECQFVYVDGFVIDGRATAVCWDGEGVHLERPAGGKADRVTLEEKLIAIVDPDSGETWAEPEFPDATDPEVLDWLASEMDGELLEFLHRFRARTKGYRPEGPAEDIDLDSVEEFHLAAIEDLLRGTRSDEYVIGDRRYWASIFLCPTPGCDCHDARIVFFDDAAELGDAVGSVSLDIAGAGGFEIVEMMAECGPRKLLNDLWERFAKRHDVGGFLRRREAQLKQVGETLWRPMSRPARAARKIGRNDPCPCGSGRKYKKCCMGKGAEPSDAGGSTRSTR